MNILILGGDYFSLAQNSNHTVVVINQPNIFDGIEPPTLATLIQQHSASYIPDIVIYTDQSRLPSVIGLEELDVPLFGFFIDSHIHYGWHREFAGIFDHVFVAQKDCCDSFNQYTGNCSWLPLFTHVKAAGVEEPILDVSFVGTLDRILNPERVKFVADLSELVSLNVHSGEYSQVFQKSKIILNQSVKTDINFRVFEALASGNLLLTDNLDNGIDLLLKEGHHFVGYQKNNPEDAAAKIRYYLEHDEERQSIARAGHEALLQGHTAAIRTRQLVGSIENMLATWGGKNPQRSQSERYYSAARTYLNVARLVTELADECGSLLPGKQIYLDQAEKCLRSVGDSTKIERITRDLAWVSIYRGEWDVAKAAIRAALQMKSHDFETFLCAAYLADDQSAAKNYLARALECINVHRDSDPFYFEVCYDQILLLAKRAGLL
jgi:hypothetical protein